MPELPAYACFVAGSPMFDVIVRGEQSIRMCFLYENAADAQCKDVRPVVVSWGGAETPTFGGHTAAEVAELCDMLAVSADRMTNSYSETAAIARRARDAIRFLLGIPKEPSGE